MISVYSCTIRKHKLIFFYINAKVWIILSILIWTLDGVLLNTMFIINFKYIRLFVLICI